MALRLLPMAYLLTGLALASPSQESVDPAALSYSRAIVVPLNSVQLFDKASDAWAWTFGLEPGARVVLSERSAGLLEGTARFNFRSQMLTGREETMGVVQYRVVVHTRPGECRIQVSELKHSGNRSTPRGGIHMGLLTRGSPPAGTVRGLGRANVQRLHQELSDQADERITGLLRAFEARLRAHAEP